MLRIADKQSNNWIFKTTLAETTPSRGYHVIGGDDTMTINAWFGASSVIVTTFRKGDPTLRLNCEPAIGLDCGVNIHCLAKS